MIRSMTRSMIKPIITSLVNPDVGDPTGATERYFAPLDDVLMSYYFYSTAIVLSAGDTFELEFLAPSSVVSSTETISDGETASNRLRIQLASDGTYRFPSPSAATLEVDGVVINSSSTYPVDGKQHKAKFTGVGTGVLKYLGVRYTIASYYSGIISNPIATISGVKTTNTLGLATGNSEPSAEANNTITYINIPDSNRELYQLSVDETQWNNISPSPQELPSVIEIA